MSKVPFLSKQTNETNVMLKNNGHSADVWLWFGYIIQVHIHAKFEDLLNTSAELLAKQILNKGACYIKTINHLGQKN